MSQVLRLGGLRLFLQEWRAVSGVVVVGCRAGTIGRVKEERQSVCAVGVALGQAGSVSG